MYPHSLGYKVGVGGPVGVHHGEANGASVVGRDAMARLPQSGSALSSPYERLSALEEMLSEGKLTKPRRIGKTFRN
jgi:hypothetical protein